MGKSIARKKILGEKDSSPSKTFFSFTSTQSLSSPFSAISLSFVGGVIQYKIDPATNPTRIFIPALENTNANFGLTCRHFYITRTVGKGT
eukprot:8344067-Ditylum_brightwellii.AAC.1